MSARTVAAYVVLAWLAGCALLVPALALLGRVNRWRFRRAIHTEAAHLHRHQQRTQQVQCLAEAAGTGQLEELWALPAAGTPYDHMKDGL